MVDYPTRQSAHHFFGLTAAVYVERAFNMSFQDHSQAQAWQGVATV